MVPPSRVGRNTPAWPGLGLGGRGPRPREELPARRCSTPRSRRCTRCSSSPATCATRGATATAPSPASSSTRPVTTSTGWWTGSCCSDRPVGNDEQYASAMALLANRVGVPARVVVGAVLPARRQGAGRGRARLGGAAGGRRQLAGPAHPGVHGPDAARAARWRRCRATCPAEPDQPSEDAPGQAQRRRPGHHGAADRGTGWVLAPGRAPGRRAAPRAGGPGRQGGTPASAAWAGTPRGPDGRGLDRARGPRPGPRRPGRGARRPTRPGPGDGRRRDRRRSPGRPTTASSARRSPRRRPSRPSGTRCMAERRELARARRLGRRVWAPFNPVSLRRRRPPRLTVAATFCVN